MKHAKRIVLLIGIFLSVYLVVRFFLMSLVGKWISSYMEFSKLNTSDIVSAISTIMSFIFAFFSDYFIKHWEKRNNAQQKAPYINIGTVRAQSVTGKRKQRNREPLEVELGKYQQEFRYVYAKIINVGQSTIVNCTIAKKTFLIGLVLKLNIQLFFWCMSL